MSGHTVTKLSPTKRPDYQSSLIELKVQQELEEKKYAEFLVDATNSPKLNDWEYKFISDLKQGYTRNLIVRFEDLSERQLTCAKRIQKRIYSIG